jgi:hypothetical protein
MRCVVIAGNGSHPIQTVYKMAYFLWKYPTSSAVDYEANGVSLQGSTLNKDRDTLSMDEDIK